MENSFTDEVFTGASLKKLREDLGWTQNMMAEFLCTTQNTIWRWESMKGEGSPKKLSAIELAVIRMLQRVEPHVAHLGIRVFHWYRNLGFGNCIVRLALYDYKLYAAKNGRVVDLPDGLRFKTDPLPEDFK